MSAAFRVKYRGPTGDCPDAVLTFESPCGECASELAMQIKETLVKARGGQWRMNDVTVREIVCIGPWFYRDGQAAK